MQQNMDSHKSEKKLAVLYSISTTSIVISLITFIVIWQQWTWTLNHCIEVDCGCILYFRSGFDSFMGGNINICRFISWAMMPSIVLSTFLACFHGYRVCIPRRLGDPRVVRRPSFTDEGRVIVVSPKDRQPFKHWIPFGLLTTILTCLSLAQAVVITDGYYKTCEQYRKYLIRTLGSRTREMQAINERLSCGAIFDYMDYVTPDNNNYRRSDFFDTGLMLRIAVIAIWINFSCWFVTTTINFVMARKRFKHLGEKILCCF